MAKKLVAVFLMCLFVMATFHVHEAEADEAQFKECYDTCHKECSDKGNGFTFCEMKCDTDCSVKDVKGVFSKTHQLSFMERISLTFKLYILYFVTIQTYVYSNRYIMHIVYYERV